MKEFADLLADWLERHPEETAAGLAKRAKLNDATVRQMIRHRRSPRLDTAQKLCAAMGTTLVEFLSESDDPQRAELALLVDQLNPAELDALISNAKSLRALRDQS